MLFWREEQYFLFHFPSSVSRANWEPGILSEDLKWSVALSVWKECRKENLRTLCSRQYPSKLAAGKPEDNVVLISNDFSTQACQTRV